jgi:short-subunit dehydrogenase
MGEKPQMRVAQTPEQVVETALKGLQRNNSHIISGWTNFLTTQSERLFPRSLITRMAGRMMRSQANKIDARCQMLDASRIQLTSRSNI